MKKLSLYILLLISINAYASKNKEIKIYYPNGILMQSFQISSNGLEGKYNIWYSDGKPAIKGEFKKGKREGVWQAWHSNGNRFYQRNFKHGAEEGQALYWFENGNICVKGQYSRGWKVGIWQYFNENGALKAMGPFERNLFNGEWLYIIDNDSVRYSYLYGGIVGMDNSDKWYPMLVRSGISITMEVNGNKRFIWRMNSKSDYQLEFDINPEKQYCGMYDFQNYARDRNEPQYIGVKKNVSFISGLKYGRQEEFYYYVYFGIDKYNNIDRQERIIDWYRPFKNDVDFGYSDYAILIGQNDSGYFKGKLYENALNLLNKKRSISKIDERKKSVYYKLGDNFYSMPSSFPLMDQSILVNDSIYIFLADSGLTFVENSQIQMMLEKGHEIIKILRTGEHSYRIFELRLNYNKNPLDFQNYILDPSYKSEILYYDRNFYSFEYYNTSLKFGSNKYLPFNILLHGDAMQQVNYNHIVYYTYDYGMLVNYRMESVKIKQ